MPRPARTGRASRSRLTWDDRASASGGRQRARASRRGRPRARARARLVDQGRGAPGAASDWRWWARRPAATAAPVRIGRSPLGGAEVEVTAAATARARDASGCWSWRTRQIAAEAHVPTSAASTASRSPGVARSAGDAMRLLTADPTIDLVLLDMHLPDGHGLGLLQRLRAAGHLCDVIAVTSARDADVVRHAVAHGVVLYLLKPFSFATFRAKLEQYADYRTGLDAAAGRRGAGRGGPAPRRAADRRPLRTAAQGHERRVAAPGDRVPARLRRSAVRHRGRRAPSAPHASRPAATSSTSPTPDLVDAGRRATAASGRPEVEYRWRTALRRNVRMIRRCRPRCSPPSCSRRPGDRSSSRVATRRAARHHPATRTTGSPWCPHLPASARPRSLGDWLAQLESRSVETGSPGSPSTRTTTTWPAC